MNLYFSLPRRLISDESEDSVSEEEEPNRVPRENGTEIRDRPRQTTGRTVQLPTPPPRIPVTSPLGSEQLPIPAPRIPITSPSRSEQLPIPAPGITVASPSGNGNLRINRVEEGKQYFCLHLNFKSVVNSTFS